MPAPNKLDDFWSFVAMVQDEDSCWLWKGTSDGRYGRFHYKQKKLKAHRYEYRNGARQVDLAERYGIYQTGISKIVNGKSWKHVS